MTFPLGRRHLRIIAHGLTDEKLQARLPHEIDQLPGMVQVVGQRLRAQHMLSRFQRRHAVLVVKVVRTVHGHDVDVLALDQLPVVGGPGPDSEFPGQGFHFRLCCAADRAHLEPRSVVLVQGEHSHAHAQPDHPDADVLSCHMCHLL
jgi:hypothetical protein